MTKVRSSYPCCLMFSFMICFTLLSTKLRLEMSGDIAVKWFRTNNMRATPYKFQVILITRGSDITPVTFDVADISIPIWENVKILGVHIDDKLKFDRYISEIKKNKTNVEVFKCDVTCFRIFAELVCIIPLSYHILIILILSGTIVTQIILSKLRRCKSVFFALF